MHCLSAAGPLFLATALLAWTAGCASPLSAGPLAPLEAHSILAEGTPSDPREAGRQIDASTRAALPGKPDFRIFTRYQARGKSTWNPAWKFDFSGVCWSSSRAGTAIGDRHVVCASHYVGRGNPDGFAYKIGENLTFTAPDGSAVTRKVVARARATGKYRYDIGCFLLDRLLPPEIRRYRLLRLSEDHSLEGCQAIRTRFHGREASLVTLSHPGPSEDFRLGASPYINYGIPSDAAWKGETLKRGDSGHPVFIMAAGQPCLVSTHSLPNMGPSYLAPDVQDAVLAAFRKLESGR